MTKNFTPILVALPEHNLTNLRDTLAELKSKNLPASQQCFFTWITQHFVSDPSMHADFQAAISAGFTDSGEGETKLYLRCPTALNWMLRERLLKLAYQNEKPIAIKVFYQWALDTFIKSQNLQLAFNAHLHELQAQSYEVAS